MMPGSTDSIWSEFHGGLHAFIRRRVSNPADADDILQEVFLRIHRRIATLSHVERLVAWLFEITRNVIVDHYRSSLRQRELPAGLAAEMAAWTPAAGTPEPPEPGSDPAQIREELAACLGSMIRRLPPPYAEAIHLVEIEGLTQRAAAARLGLSLSGMKSRVQRGRRKLKGILEDCCRIRLDASGGIAAYEARDRSGCGSCASGD
jgi:RNA polymerase sigma-70 factor (ECF subfamily)